MVLVNLTIDELQTLNAEAYKRWEEAVEGIWAAREATLSRDHLLEAGMPDPAADLKEHTAWEAHYKAEMARYSELIAAARAEE